MAPPAQSMRSPFGSGEYARMRFDLREPSRPGSVGDKLQSGESPWMGESVGRRAHAAGWSGDPYDLMYAQ